jgi:hypothetical protein
LPYIPVSLAEAAVLDCYNSLTLAQQADTEARACFEQIEIDERGSRQACRPRSTAPSTTNTWCTPFSSWHRFDAEGLGESSKM